MPGGWGGTVICLFFLLMTHQNFRSVQLVKQNGGFCCQCDAICHLSNKSAAVLLLLLPSGFSFHVYNMYLLFYIFIFHCEIFGCLTSYSSSIFLSFYIVIFHFDIFCCLTVHLSVYLSVCLSDYLSSYLSVDLPVYIFGCSFLVCFTVYSVHNLVCVSDYLLVSLSLYFTGCISVYLSVFIFVCFQVCLSFNFLFNFFISSSWLLHFFLFIVLRIFLTIFFFFIFLSICLSIFFLNFPFLAEFQLILLSLFRWCQSFLYFFFSIDLYFLFLNL